MCQMFIHLSGIVTLTDLLRFEPSDVTRAAIDPFTRQQKTKDTYESPTEPPKIDEKNWAKTMEAMDEWLT